MKAMFVSVLGLIQLLVGSTLAAIIMPNEVPSNLTVVLGYHPMNHDRHMALWDINRERLWWWRLISSTGCTEPRINAHHIEDSTCAGEAVLRFAKSGIEKTKHKMDQLGLVVASLNHMRATYDKQEIQRHAALLQNDILITTEHHRCHASYAFFSGPFEKAIAVTIDYFGSDLHHTAIWYAAIGAGAPKLLYSCEYCWFGIMFRRFNPEEIAWHSITTEPDTKYVQRIRNFLTALEIPSDPETHRFGWIAADTALSKFFARNGPNTPAKMSGFSHVIVEMITEQVKKFPGYVAKADGLVVGGGVARNSALPYLLGRALNLPVWRPLNPSDATLAIGAAWNVLPPRRPGVRSVFFTSYGRQRGSFCAPYTREKLAEFLRKGPVAILQTDLGQSEIAPASHSVVSCTPLSTARSYHRHPCEVFQTAIVASDNVTKLFETPIELYSISAAYRLLARDIVQREHNITLAIVVSLQRGTDPMQDDLLHAAASACKLPLLFSGPVPQNFKHPAAHRHKKEICWSSEEDNREGPTGGKGGHRAHKLHKSHKS